jgi:hypothetical protein
MNIQAYSTVSHCQSSLGFRIKTVYQTFNDALVFMYKIRRFILRHMLCKFKQRHYSLVLYCLLVSEEVHISITSHLSGNV